MKNLHLIICIACLTANIKAQSPDTWLQKADFGGGGRHAAAGFAIGNKGYIGTGVDSNFACTNGFWEYDPVSNIWTQKANYGGGIMCWAVSFSIGSKGYVGVGPSLTAFWEYDPATNNWTQKANFGGGPRDGASGFSTGTKGYVGLGRLGPNYLNDFWEYNPATNSWSQKSNFPGTPRAYATGFSIGNEGYLGLGGNGTFFSDFYMYYDYNGSNLWMPVQSLPGTARYGAVGFSIGNKGYIGTGQYSSVGYYLNDFWEFNPGFGGTWIQKANFGGTARVFAVGFSLGNKGYIGTGTNFTADFWEYTPCSYPSATITAGGPTTFCSGGNVILTANTGAGLTYQWKKSGINISGATASNYSATASGSYTCVISNGVSCSTSSNYVTVTVNPFPVAVISGTASICNGSSTNIIITVSNGPGPYSITYNPGGIVVNSAVSPIAILVSPSVTTNYTLVSVVNANCAGTVSGNAMVTVNPLPSATITAGGSTTFCSGGSVVLNAVVAANKTYQWKKNNANISGATLSSYTATATGNYKVTVTNTQTGCSKTTAVATVITVNAKPAATITPQGPTTFCAGGSVVLSANTGTGLTYKWKKGGNYISGATLSNYTATTAGTYRVEVTNSNGCSKLSAGVTVTVPCKLDGSEGESRLHPDRRESEFDVKVFPNPNSGEFTIEFSNKPPSPLLIELTDEFGKVVKKFETSDETLVIKESNLANGIYGLTVRNKNEVILKKISIVQ